MRWRPWLVFRRGNERRKLGCEKPVVSNPIKPGTAYENDTAGPESSAARVALHRALHLEADPPPYAFADEIGLRLLAPDTDWRWRADVDERASRRGFRRCRALVSSRSSSTPSR